MHSDTFYASRLPFLLDPVLLVPHEQRRLLSTRHERRLRADRRLLLDNVDWIYEQLYESNCERTLSDL